MILMLNLLLKLNMTLMTREARPALQRMCPSCSRLGACEIAALGTGTHMRTRTDTQNAGINVPAVPMEELSVEQYRSLMAVNVDACFYCAQEAVKIMKTQDPKGGR